MMLSITYLLLHYVPLSCAVSSRSTGLRPGPLTCSCCCPDTPPSTPAFAVETGECCGQQKPRVAPQSFHDDPPFRCHVREANIASSFFS
ncbi:hypothetical protein [Frankia sp. CcWB3]